MRLFCSSSTLGYKAFVACDHCGLGIIHIGLLEETELELLQQNAARSLPDPRIRNQSVMDILHDEIRLFRSSDLIYACVDRLRKALRLRQLFHSPGHADFRRSGLDTGGRSIAAGLGTIIRNRPVTYDDAAKSVLPAQQLTQKLMIKSGAYWFERLAVDGNFS